MTVQNFNLGKPPPTHHPSLPHMPAIAGAYPLVKTHYYLLMDAFALKVLEDAKSWNWPIVKHIQQSGNQGKALVPSLLSCLIKESQALGGTVLDQFWEAVGKCDDKLKDNSGSNSSASECQGPRGWRNVDPVYRVGGGGSTGGANFFL
jgi:hypothetical protein